MAFDNCVLEQPDLKFTLQPEQKVNILLIDDDPKNLLALEAGLDRLGQNLVKAHSGKEALRYLLEGDFAVILLDVQMPGMDGFDTAKLIRERERSQHTPIIFLTAFRTSLPLMFQGYSLGPVDYLLKPIEPEILTSKVGVFVELFNKRAEVKRQAAQLAAVNTKLTESEERFRSLSACSPVGIFLADIEGRCTYTNPPYQAICGFTQEESRGRGASWLQLVHPEDREQVLTDWSGRILKGQEYSKELRCQTQEGIVRWVHVRSCPMLSDKGELTGHVGTLEDITSRKQAEIALQTANEALECRVQERTAKLRAANEQLCREIAERKRTEAELEKSLSLLYATLQSTASGIVAVNLEGDIVTFNQQFVDMWQIPDSMMTLQDCGQHLDFLKNQLKNPETFDKCIREAYSQPDVEDYEHLELKDGRIFECYSKPQRLGEKIIGIVWSFRDITKRKQTEEALRQSEAKFRTLAETTEAIIFISQGTHFSYVNPAAEAITGYKREELLAYPDIYELIKERGQVLRPGKSVFSPDEEIKHCEEIKILTKNGEERWLDCCVGVIEFEGKLAVLGTAIDITKRKQAEAEIRQALEQEKELSELRARFISIVSHEFRTPLNNISLSASSLRRYSHQWTESEKLDYLRCIETDVEQLSHLLDEVLIIGGAEAGKRKFEPRPLDLRQFCLEIVKGMQLSDNGKHAFSFVSQGECRAVCVDKKLLRPILTNLIDNAIKYSPANSKIDLKLLCRDDRVIFQIKDRGIGIPITKQKQLFEPFDRGSNVGNIQGTGLGLSVVKKFLDIHGGQINVVSKVGMGTTFTVTLPVNKFLER